MTGAKIRIATLSRLAICKPRSDSPNTRSTNIAVVRGKSETTANSRPLKDRQSEETPASRFLVARSRLAGLSSGK